MVDLGGVRDTVASAELVASRIWWHWLLTGTSNARGEHPENPAAGKTPRYNDVLRHGADSLIQVVERPAPAAVGYGSPLAASLYPRGDPRGPRRPGRQSTAMEQV